MLRQTFVTYLQQLYGPLNALGTLYRVVNTNIQDAENLIKLLQVCKRLGDQSFSLFKT